MKRTVHICIYPEVSRLKPNDTTLPLHLSISGKIADSDTVKISVYHLGRIIDVQSVSLPDSESLDHWEFVYALALALSPLSLGIGLGIVAEINGAFGHTAIDCGSGPVRYGFVSDFTPADGERDEGVIAFLLQNHITHVQFYDWAYRPHQFAPDASDEVLYHDTMGKPIALYVVKDLLRAMHRSRIAGLAYGAVYAAGKEYITSHPKEALYDAEGNTYDLIEKFFIMNCDNPEWRERILSQYRYAVDEVGFDGIHMDTYGYPKWGWGVSAHASSPAAKHVAAGTVLKNIPPKLKGKSFEKIFLEASFVSLINQWAGYGSENIFNNVGGWPAAVTAYTDQAAVYIEVWEPYTQFHHLRSLMMQASQAGKPVILAAYLEPFKEHDGTAYGPIESAKLLLATVSSHGATSLLVGEDGAVLTQPYYSDYARLTEDELILLQTYYDFQVSYRELLYAPDLVDITESYGSGENREIDCIIDGGSYETSIDGEAGTVWAIMHMNGSRVVISLINLIDQTESYWNREKEPCRTRPNAVLRIPRFFPVMKVYTCSPDMDHGLAREIPMQETHGAKGPAVEVELTQISQWTLIWCDGEIQ